MIYPCLGFGRGCHPPSELPLVRCHGKLWRVVLPPSNRVSGLVGLLTTAAAEANFWMRDRFGSDLIADMSLLEFLA